jgi:hypothetical protein
MDKQAHTPTPWMLNKRRRAPMIGFDVGDGGDLLPIAPVIHGYNVKVAKANARFIVRACNAYDSMLAAIRASEDEYDEETEQSDASCPDCTLGCIPITKARTCAHHLRQRVLREAEQS